MQKAISLEVTLTAPAGQTPEAVQALVASTIAGEHEGLTIQVGSIPPGAADATGAIQIPLLVQGDRPAPENFTQLTTDLVQRLWHAQTGLESAGPGGAPPQLVQIVETENEDDEEESGLESAGLEAAGAHHRRCIAAIAGDGAIVGTGLHTLPADKPRPAPLAETFDECPPDGERGSDTGTNLQKNRIDTGQWQAATIPAIIALNPQIPPGLPRRRSAWNALNKTAIGHYEGLPLQVQGYLGGVAEELPESCNCHSVNGIDYHLWLVDAPGKTRDHSVVIELSPRVRSVHPNWTFERLCAVVKKSLPVRISGWLMLDPEHPDDVGHSRGTIWEIHPIMQIEVQQNHSWVALDTATLPG